MTEKTVPPTKPKISLATGKATSERETERTQGFRKKLEVQYICWEYAFDSAFGSEGTIRLLNRYGVDGWELVSATEGANGRYTFFFKRPVVR